MHDAFDVNLYIITTGCLKAKETKCINTFFLPLKTDIHTQRACSDLTQNPPFSDEIHSS